MSESTKYEAQKKKLEGLCEEHDLTYRIRKDSYPITLTIRPIQGVTEQLSLLEKDENEYISPEASMKWMFADGELTSKVEGGTFTISKVLRTKIENIFLKMISFWQQYFFRYLIVSGIVSARNMPVIDEMEADDSGDEDELPEDEEPEEADEEDPDEDLITAATLLVRQENKASVSLLQRRLTIGYAKSARLIDILEERGIVGPYRGAEPREVLPADVPEEG